MAVRAGALVADGGGEVRPAGMDPQFTLVAIGRSIGTTDRFVDRGADGVTPLHRRRLVRHTRSEVAHLDTGCLEHSLT